LAPDTEGEPQVDFRHPGGDAQAPDPAAEALGQGARLFFEADYTLTDARFRLIHATETNGRERPCQDTKVDIRSGTSYVASAGVSAGTDMGFYLVSRLAGRAVAENAVKAAEYDWHRDPGEPIYYP
jgi:hypothetical protein